MFNLLFIKELSETVIDLSDPDYDAVLETKNRLLYQTSPAEIRSFLISTPKQHLFRHMLGRVLFVKAMLLSFATLYPTCCDPLVLTLDVMTTPGSENPVFLPALIFATRIQFSMHMLSALEGSETYWSSLGDGELEMVRQFCLLMYSFF